jgi:hypothetical protein
VVIKSGLIEVRTSLEPWKWFLKLHIDLLSHFGKPRKIRIYTVHFDNIFRKYFQKRNFRRKNGLKQAYNEGVMIFVSLTTETTFLKTACCLAVFDGQLETLDVTLWNQVTKNKLIHTKTNPWT